MSSFRLDIRLCSQTPPEVSWAHRVDDAVPADHPVRHLDDLLRVEGFAETFSSWTQAYILTEVKPPYHPRDLSALYLYGMMNRLLSSRHWESALRVGLAHVAIGGTKAVLWNRHRINYTAYTGFAPIRKAPSSRPLSFIH